MKRRTVDGYGIEERRFSHIESFYIPVQFTAPSQPSLQPSRPRKAC